MKFLPSEPQPGIRQGRENAAKRAFDMGLAAAGLLASIPVWLVSALAIKLEDGGPVFYVQDRWGKGKRLFKAYKFRTMTANAGCEQSQAQEDDSRITRVGRFLRATAMDELPQLLNILKGDMSFVGPRALPVDEVQIRENGESLPDEAIPGFELRSRVRPGLTGIAQIYAPRDITRRQKFRYDATYIRKMSLWLDLRLIVLSILVTLVGCWETREKKLPRWLMRGVWGVRAVGQEQSRLG